MVPLVSTVRSAGAALLCRAAPLASPCRSLLPELPCRCPCTVIHLHTAVPVDPHLSERCLESDALLFKSLFNISVRLTLLRNHGRIIAIKVQWFTSKCNLLSPCFLDNHLLDAVLLEIDHYGPRGRVGVWFPSQGSVCALNLQVSVLRKF